jgi:hypothetical protein
VSDLLVWQVGNRNPSITETITVDGAAVDLNVGSSTVKFQARELGSSTLLVDAAATIVQTGSGGSAVNKGQVRYDWTSGDATTGILSAPRLALIWWRVTTSAKDQDVGEALIEIRSHGPLTNCYVELEQFKSTADLKDTNFMDIDIALAIRAAARAVDEICARRFYPDTDATQVRYYTPSRSDHVYIDDLVTLTTLKTDEGRDGTFENTWASTDYWLEPLNAAADGEPYTAVRVNPDGGFQFWPGYTKSIQVTGKFGWATTPAAISEATTILAGRFLKRTREAPFGAAEALALGGAAVRLTGRDADVTALLGPYMRYPYTP